MLTQKARRAMQQTTGASNQEQHLRAQLELLQNHQIDPDSTPGSADSGAACLSQSPPSRPANGYGDLAAVASRDAARAVAVKSEAEAHIHPDLRGPSTQVAPTPNMMPISATPPSVPSPVPAPAPSPGPAIAPAPPSAATDHAMAMDGRKAKRELSQSKRAAQNRAAQRAFRQRKEGYIKKLEQQVREYNDMEQTYKAMQSENFALREYVIHLQSRLIDLQGEIPQPPPNINLAPPTAASQQQSQQQQANPGGPEQTTSSLVVGVATPLEAVAQAVAGLAAQEQMTDSPQVYVSRGSEDTRTAEEINRQLHSEDGSAQSP